MITLYGYDTINTLKVLVMLLETKLPYELVSVNIKTGEQHHPEFLAINPVAKVPVLVDGELVLPESNAILIYLAKKAAWGVGDESSSHDKIVSSLFFQASTQGPYFGQIEYWTEFAKVPNPEALAHYREIAMRVIDLMDTALGKSEFLCGETYSIADIAHHAWMHHCAHLGLSLEKVPNVIHWYEIVGSRPATVEAIELLSSMKSSD